MKPSFTSWVIVILLLAGGVCAVPLGGEIYYDFENQVNNQWNAFGNGVPVGLVYRDISNNPTKAGFFDGSARIDTSAPIIDSRGTNFTILFQFMHNTSIGSLEVFYSQLRAPGDTRVFFYMNGTGHPVFTFLLNTTSSNVNVNNQSFFAPNSNTWQSLAVVFNDSRVTMYLNGTQMYDNLTMGKVVSQLSGNAYIGTSANGFILNYVGGMDTFKTFNRSLSHNDVLNELGLFSPANVSLVIVNDSYTGAGVSFFNVSWVNSSTTLTNTSSTGVAYYDNISGFYNITVSANGWYPNTTYNWNVGSPLLVSLSRGTVAAIANFPGFNITISDTATGTQYAFKQTATNTALLYLAETGTPNGNLTLEARRAGSTDFEATFLHLYNDHVVNPLFYENTSILNVTFFDAITGSRVNNISIDLIGVTNLSTNTTTGNKYIENIMVGDYIIRYANVENRYAINRYSFNVPANSYNELSLYLMNSSRVVNITATVYDQLFNELEGAILEVHRYNPATGTYLLVDRLSTNFEGDAFFTGDTYGEFYRFLIRYNGVLVYSSTPTILTGDPLSFKVILSTPIATSFYALTDLQYTFGFNNATNAFNLVYSYPSLLSVNMTTVRETQAGDVQVQSTILSTSSGIIGHAITNTTGVAYRSCFWVNFGSGWELVDCAFADFNPHIPSEGSRLALFLLLIFEIIVAFLFVADIVLGLIAFPLPFLFFEIAGLTNIGLEYAVGIEVLFIIIAVIVGRNA